MPPCPPEYWKVCIWFHFAEVNARESTALLGTCPGTQCYFIALTRLQSPCIPFVLRGHPVFSKNVLMRLLERFSGVGSPGERTRSTSVSWPALQVPLLPGVEGFSVSAEETRLSRGNSGTQNTESFVQTHMSTLPLLQISVWWRWVSCSLCKLIKAGISVVKGGKKRLWLLCLQHVWKDSFIGWLSWFAMTSCSWTTGSL